MLSAARLPQVQIEAYISLYKPVENEVKFVELSEPCSAK